MEQLPDEPKGRLEPVNHGQRVLSPEDGREVLGPLGPIEPFQRRKLQLEDAAVKEEDGAERLVLGGGRGGALDREVVEEGRELGGFEVARMAAPMEEDERPDPVEVGLLGARGVVEAAKGGARGFDEGDGGVLGGWRRAGGRNRAPYRSIGGGGPQLLGAGRFFLRHGGCPDGLGRDRAGVSRG